VLEAIKAFLGFIIKYSEESKILIEVIDGVSEEVRIFFHDITAQDIEII